MFPALRYQFALQTVQIPNPYLPPSSYDSDFPNPNSCDARRHLFRSRSGKEQFVILPAMQGKTKVRLSIHRNSIRFNLRPHSTLFANVAQIDGEPVASIDHGRRQSLFAEKAPLSNSRHGVEVTRKVTRSNLLAAREQIDRCG